VTADTGGGDEKLSKLSDSESIGAAGAAANSTAPVACGGRVVRDGTAPGKPLTIINTISTI
jgi:hypothetical protein